MAKRFFYVCAGLFLLAMSWHLGAQNAGAQSQKSPIVGITAGNVPGRDFVLVAIAENGDLFGCRKANGVWAYDSNIFGKGGSWFDRNAPRDTTARK